MIFHMILFGVMYFKGRVVVIIIPVNLLCCGDLEGEPTSRLGGGLLFPPETTCPGTATGDDVFTNELSLAF